MPATRTTTTAAVAGGAVALGAAAATLTRGGRKSRAAAAAPESRVTRLIRDEAERRGVSPNLALLFADLESGLRSNAVGDKNWHQIGDNYQRFVLDNPKYDENPFRGDRELWVSYGLFQLIAAFFLWRHDPTADPRVLLDPEVNAELGVAHIATLVDRYGADPLRVRMAYVCGSPAGCTLSKAEKIARRMARKGGKWGFAFGEEALVARARKIAEGVA